MDHSSLLLQIPQPSSSTYTNGVSSNSPMPQDNIPQLHKLNPKRFSRSTRTLHSHHNSPKIFVHGDKLSILRDLCSNIPATPTPRKIAVTEEEIEELSRGIAGLYVKSGASRQRGLNSPTTNSKQRRLNVSSTTTRGGSAGLFGTLIQRPGRFKVRTVVLGGTSTSK
ncbi:hypothetical protein FH972_016541 [Carpinus fangiana]|uniref:Uncharacterized protein n=1 Tax=Carpinus fangiana TaxID=176857 RepID=A0A5N6RHG5_9ROSI|nr:hypothetical protein FH972_016541 [Carpinus fangiana]